MYASPGESRARTSPSRPSRSWGKHGRIPRLSTPTALRSRSSPAAPFSTSRDGPPQTAASAGRGTSRRGCRARTTTPRPGRPASGRLSRWMRSRTYATRGNSYSAARTRLRSGREPTWSRDRRAYSSRASTPARGRARRRWASTPSSLPRRQGPSNALRQQRLVAGRLLPGEILPVLARDRPPAGMAPSSDHAPAAPVAGSLFE